MRQARHEDGACEAKALATRTFGTTIECHSGFWSSNSGKAFRINFTVLGGFRSRSSARWKRALLPVWQREPERRVVAAKVDNGKAGQADRQTQGG